MSFDGMPEQVKERNVLFGRGESRLYQLQWIHIRRLLPIIHQLFDCTHDVEGFQVIKEIESVQHERNIRTASTSFQYVANFDLRMCRLKVGVCVTN